MLRKLIYILFGIALVLATGNGLFLPKASHHFEQQKQGLSDRKEEVALLERLSGHKVDADPMVYQAPDNEKRNRNYVQTKSLEQPGNFNFTSLGDRRELMYRESVHRTTCADGMQYTVKCVKRAAHEARTKKALQDARVVYDEPHLQDKFYTMLVVYELKNMSSMPLWTQGIASGTFNQRDTVTMLGGIGNDPKLGQAPLAPGETTESYAMLVVPKEVAVARKVNVELEFAMLRTDQAVDFNAEPATINFHLDGL